jgi:hypothetical protein
MATSKLTDRARDGASRRKLAGRYHAIIAVAVEGAALLLRLPLVLHIVASVLTELAFALLRQRSR